MTQVAADGARPAAGAGHASSWATPDQPFAFVAGGSSGVRSVGPAVKLAAEAAPAKVLELAIGDEDRRSAATTRG